MSLYDQTNFEIRAEIAETLGFFRSGENMRFCNNLRMIPNLLHGWDVNDATLAYIDYIKQRACI
jgi:hypothetical protein